MHAGRRKREGQVAAAGVSPTVNEIRRKKKEKEKENEKFSCRRWTEKKERGVEGSE